MAEGDGGNGEPGGRVKQQVQEIERLGGRSGGGAGGVMGAMGGQHAKQGSFAFDVQAGTELERGLVAAAAGAGRGLASGSRPLPLSVVSTSALPVPAHTPGGAAGGVHVLPAGLSPFERKPRPSHQDMP